MLRFMTMDSLSAFTSMVESYRPDEIIIESVNRVKNVRSGRRGSMRCAWGEAEDAEGDEAKEPLGLFLLDVTRSQDDQEFQFNVAPRNFLSAVIDIFEKG